MTDILELIFNIGLYHYLLLALILFIMGFFGAIVSKNVLKVLISIEFMLTAVNINFIAFASFFDNIKLEGFVFSLFYIALGAVEVAIALSIFYLMFRQKRSVNTEDYKELKG
ncbi:MAG TPA: NADH-quinone oxidoreductase subunit NuoK [Candidatus Gastranaerophilaceae bacterium]|nr:NADH-quinone oxidoreductase subunit NuoK [Candidatus Gastranaerophilaceae bacterium]HPT42024.1 NADH-quinone oxidoreductase subunit NuoK [Candidatus Gastranaerophilaceae bacterium]